MAPPVGQKYPLIMPLEASLHPLPVGMVVRRFLASGPFFFSLSLLNSQFSSFCCWYLNFDPYSFNF